MPETDAMRIALQLYTLRKSGDELPTMLRKVADLGYAGVEFAGFGGLPATEVRQLLDDAGLEGVSSHVQFTALQDGLDDVIAYHQAVGASHIVCPSLPEDRCNARDVSLRTAATLRTWGQEVVAHGLQFGYHNHWVEFETVFGDERLFDLLFSPTSAAELKLELDVCWAQRGGQDAVACLARHADRTPLIHIKDMVRDESGRYTTVPLGDGIMDLDAVVAASAAASVEWLIVEQDDCEGDAYADAARSFAWLRQHGLTAQR